MFNQIKEAAFINELEKISVRGDYNKMLNLKGRLAKRLYKIYHSPEKFNPNTANVVSEHYGKK